jgi:hypothetical protein
MCGRSAAEEETVMRSNASTFRAHAFVQSQMIAAVMPELAALEAASTVRELEERAPALRVKLGEVAGTRLFGFRSAEEVQ